MDDYDLSLSFNVGLAQELSIEAAIVYNDLNFWSTKGGRDDGWVYKSYAEMLGKFPLSEYQLRKAYKQLAEAGYIETKLIKKNGAPTFHYRFLKNFRNGQLDSEKTSETMDSEKTSETIYIQNNTHNTDNSDFGDSTGAAAKPIKSSADTERGDVLDVFVELVSILHPGQVIMFTTGRRQQLKSRLKHFKPDEIVEAANNLMASPWHTGDNPNKKKYASYDFLLRKDEQVEKWLNEKPVKRHKSAF